MRSKDPDVSRRKVLSAAIVAVERVARGGGVVAVHTEAGELLKIYPDCGLSHGELQQDLVRLALDRRLAIQFGPKVAGDDP